MVRLSLVFASLLLMAAAPDVSGLWMTQDRSGVVEIAPCDGGMCGWLVGFRDQPPPQDWQGVSECGLQFIHPMRLGDDGKLQGMITDPETGGQYRAWVSLAADGTLHLRGYLGIALFGQTQVWRRFTGQVDGACRIE